MLIEKKINLSKVSFPQKTDQFEEFSKTFFDEESAMESSCSLELSNYSFEDITPDLEYIPQLQEGLLEEDFGFSEYTMHAYINTEYQDYALILANYVAKKMRYDLDIESDEYQFSQLGKKIDNFEVPIVSEDIFLETFGILNRSEYFSTVVGPIFEESSSNRFFENGFSRYEIPKDNNFLDYPIIIVTIDSWYKYVWEELLPSLSHHIIFVDINSKEAQKRASDLIYITNTHVQVHSTVSMDYYHQFFRKELSYFGRKLDKDVSTKSIYNQLKTYRGRMFLPIKDTQHMVNRISEFLVENPSLFVEQQHIDRILNNNSKVLSKDNALKEISSLVGLYRAKDMVKTLKNNFIFNKSRKQMGLPPINNNFVLAFLGNPGTAKTTFAKLLAQYLRAEGVLSSDKFVIGTRKNLVGEYIGETAGKVASLFQENKGGTIFIDEAYSLYSKESPKDFGVEAMAELMFQIEENPDTLVIFAGYPKEMDEFIKKSNTGLQSRITHTLHFDDYTSDEMFEILKRFIIKDQFELVDEVEVREYIREYLNSLTSLQKKELGNGRFIRTVYQRAIEIKLKRESFMQDIGINEISKALYSLNKEIHQDYKKNDKKNQNPDIAQLSFHINKFK